MAGRVTFHIEHILARQHGGKSEAGNLALACSRCNFKKGTNLVGIDPDTGQMTRLFNPRVDNWEQHFCMAIETSGGPEAHTGPERLQ